MDEAGSPAAGEWDCILCGACNASFYWPQCGTCGADAEVSYFQESFRVVETSSEAPYEQNTEEVEDASSSKEAAIQKIQEHLHEQRQWSDSPGSRSAPEPQSESSSSQIAAEPLPETTTKYEQGPVDNVREMESSLTESPDNEIEKSPLARPLCQNGFWVCGICFMENFNQRTPEACPMCNHRRDYQIECCVNPGERLPESSFYLPKWQFNISNEGFAIEGTSPTWEEQLPEGLTTSRDTKVNLVHGSRPKMRRHSESSSASYANSELSIASLASSATNLSLHGTYAPAQIAQATNELISILRDDEALSAFYVRAVADVNIGPPKLERNLRRFFKMYSEQLKQEAGESLELLASRLVGLKARAVARSIVQYHSPDSAASYHVKHSTLIDRQEESSDDDVEPQPVDEELLQDLNNFRQFLTGGEAFQSLRKQVRSFVMPKAGKQELAKQSDRSTAIEMPLHPPAVEEHNNAMIMMAAWNDSTQVDINHREATVDLVNKKVFDGSILCFVRNFAVGLLTGMIHGEPPIQPGFTRLRWKCRCGHTICGDVIELREGGVSKTVDRVRRSTGVEVVVTPHGQRSDTQASTARISEWIQVPKRKLSVIWQRITDLTPGLPQHTTSGSAIACHPSITAQSQQQALLLMSCMKGGRYFRKLFQDGIDGIEADQTLFCFMQRQIKQRQGFMRRMFSYECIRAIHFVKFRLRASGYVEVRARMPCSTSTSPTACDCIPPSSKVEPSPGAEYRCKPAGPPETCPPILSEELMHMLNSPRCIDPNETFVLDQLPKRTKGELKGTIGQPAEGWGIHFQEGWDFDLLIGMILAVFLLASLLFAVLWSHFKLDVQGAFGVSSYMVTATGIFVAWFANRAGKMS